MKEREEAFPIREFSAALRYGLVGIGLLLALLFASAFLADSYQEVYLRPTLTGKICFALSALTVGFLCAGKARKGRLIQALIGESVLLLGLLICIPAFGFHVNWISLIVDVVLMLFGAFAGSVLCVRPKRKRRGKR